MTSVNQIILIIRIGVVRMIASEKRGESVNLMTGKPEHYSNN